MKRGSAHLIAAISGAALLAAGAVFTTVYIATTGIHLRKLQIMPEGGIVVGTLPKNLEQWNAIGTDSIPSKEAIDALGTENFLTRTYAVPADSDIARKVFGDEDPRPIRISLHLAYYTGLVDTVPHVPERCFVGAGMQISGSPQAIDIPLDRSRLIEDTRVPDEIIESMSPSGGAFMMARSSTTFSRVRLPPNLDDLAMRVTPFRDDTQGVTLLAGYFFIANGEIVPNANQVRLKAFELEDDYAYYLKVQFTSSDLDTPEQLAMVAGSMLDEMFADLMLRTPDWVKVRQGTYPPGRGDAPDA